jgi:hypothetical protein
MDFDEYMQMLKVKLENTEVSVENLMKILQFAMEIVEMTELKGNDQKNMAIKLVRQVVVESPIEDDKKNMILNMIDQGILANTVDLVVDASKGNVNINKVVKVASGCCGALCK